LFTLSIFMDAVDTTLVPRSFSKGMLPVIIKVTLLINHYNKNKLTIFRISIVHVDF
jgi:hypothetical protein